MKTLLITLASLAMTSGIVANAFYQKKQFYSSVVYITKSNPCMSVIYIQAFVFVVLIGKLFRFIFFGELRPNELESLIEKSWYAITDMCLAFTIFREDLNHKFVFYFTLLFFLKCFHWLAEDRVDYMERSPNISLLFHLRINALIIILASIDIMFVVITFFITTVKGASVQILFGFEYAILLSVITTISFKYILHCLDLVQRDVPWENKSVYFLYYELFSGFYKAVLNLCFIIFMARAHSFPLFAVRPMYLSLKAFQKTLNDVMLSRRAIRNMNTLYPDATPQELATVDNVCIICREEMSGNGTAKKLPCNHIFHVSCLRSWFQRQQTCPTCRMNILRPANNRTTNNQNNQQATPQENNQPNNQQPQANQQQQPGQANVNFRFLLNGFNIVDNITDFILQDRQQLNQQNNQQTNNNSQENNNNNQTNRNTTTNNVIHPSLMSLSFMPFLPFPLPLNTSSTNINNQNLSSLTEEELRALEGNERNALEARIRLLQNLRTSIDAIVFQFQQYNQLVVSNSNLNSNVPNSSESQENNSPKDSSEKSKVDKDKVNVEKPSTSKTIKTENTDLETGNNEDLIKNEKEDSNDSNSEPKIIRIKRLIKFHGTQTDDENYPCSSKTEKKSSNELKD